MMPPAQMFLTSHEGWVVSYLTGHNINICDHKGFPSPLEVWVVSYVLATVATIATLGVSVPSRGMGGFLQNGYNLYKEQLSCFRPLSRYGWFPTLISL